MSHLKYLNSEKRNLNFSLFWQDNLSTLNRVLQFTFPTISSPIFSSDQNDERKPTNQPSQNSEILKFGGEIEQQNEGENLDKKENKMKKNKSKKKKDFKIEKLGTNANIKLNFDSDHILQTKLSIIQLTLKLINFAIKISYGKISSLSFTKLFSNLVLMIFFCF